VRVERVIEKRRIWREKHRGEVCSWVFERAGGWGRGKGEGPEIRKTRAEDPKIFPPKATRHSWPLIEQNHNSGALWLAETKQSRAADKNASHSSYSYSPFITTKSCNYSHSLLFFRNKNRSCSRNSSKSDWTHSWLYQLSLWW
jgi:hypothetical protein